MVPELKPRDSCLQDKHSILSYVFSKSKGNLLHPHNIPIRCRQLTWIQLIWISIQVSTAVLLEPRHPIQVMLLHWDIVSFGSLNWQQSPGLSWPFLKKTLHGMLFILQDVLLAWCFFIIRFSLCIVSGNILEGMCILQGYIWFKFRFVPFQVSSRLLHSKISTFHFAVTKHFEGRFEAAWTLCYIINFPTSHFFWLAYYWWPMVFHSIQQSIKYCSWKVEWELSCGQLLCFLPVLML